MHASTNAATHTLSTGAAEERTRSIDVMRPPLR
jgi:hypothetical protein